MGENEYKFSDNEFCLDYVIDNCPTRDKCKNHGHGHEIKVRAVIRDTNRTLNMNDEDLEEEFSIFGSNKESKEANLVKISGYPISVIFLVLALIILKRYDPNKNKVRHTSF